MKKINLLFISAVLPLVLFPVGELSAGSRNTRDGMRHEVRLGVGDMCFETLIWHDQIHQNYTGTPDGSLFVENTSYRYTPHFSGEYAFHATPWLSIGAIADFQYTGWQRDYYNNTNVSQRTTRENFYNLVIMPTIRFNYFRRNHVGLYSSISGGLGINGGSEANGFGKKTVCCGAFQLCLVGVRAGAGHWWAFADFGLLASMQSPNIMYMLGSELVKAGVSFKF
ncbi:MAG: hypothetical protein MJY62_03715 [Bacteroidales bacterium]|nr:hypothetical protein [Bacteroidales bacterium]